MASSLTIAERRADSVTILELAGRLIVDDGERALRDYVDSLARSGRTKLLVNMKDVTYIDSGGVGALVSKYLTVKKAGGDLKLLHLNRRAGRVLEITRLVEVFDIFENEADALTSFQISSVTQK